MSACVPSIQVPSDETQAGSRPLLRSTPTQLDRPTLPSGLDILNALPLTLDAVEYRVPIGESLRRIGVRIDAKELDLQLPDDDVGDILVGLSKLAIGPVQGKRRGNEKTDKRDGDNAQCQ